MNRFLQRNSATILTCLGAVGVVATAVLAAKATPKAIDRLKQAEEEKGEELSKGEKVSVAGPAYIPAIVTGTSTIVCIFGANILNKRAQAALASAYALLDSSYKEYKRKLGDLYGEEADVQIREKIAKDRYDEECKPVSKEEMLVFDNFSMRFFETTLEELLGAEYRFNRIYEKVGSACLNDFYDMVGLGQTESGHHLGWSIDSGVKEIRFDHERIELDDGLEGYILVLLDEPTEEYIY